jgi:dihydrofolate synthase/folylpolyglutamate synthase
MNYNEAIEYIHSTYRFGSKLGLDNIKKLLDKLDNPQNGLRIIHVAGTNGKGSISAMIRSVLTASGYKTGFFISPYLERFTERIQIDNEEISEEDLAQNTHDVKIAVDKLLQEGCNHPTEFEIVTAIGFLYFKRKNIDFLVLEVGLGGRFDATNVIEDSLISVISSISLEHTQYLGDTIEKIAYEKAGIIKNDNKVVLYPQSREAMEVVKKQAELKNSKVFVPDLANLIKTSDEKFKYQGEYFELKNFKTNFIGEHQQINMAVAIKTIEILFELGFKIEAENIRHGLESAFMPGRFELVHNNPDIIIDCAHNYDGLKAFTKTIKNIKKDKRLLLFIGMLDDKKPETIPVELIKLSDKIYTLTPDNPRGIPSDKLSKIISKKYKVESITSLDSYDEAAKLALSQNNNYISAFVGSFYMVGNIRTILKKL